MINQTQLKNFFKGKNIVVTGALGSIGSAIAQAVLEYGVKSVRCLDNRETELFYAQKKNKDPRVIYCFADIRDKNSIGRNLRGADIVFHAAAMKHVSICETHPFEAVSTNVIGTKNIIELCADNNVEKMILISTDKAINPEGVMGTTKLLAERLISATGNMDVNVKTTFAAVRFGNVLYSRGSVLEIWGNQLAEGKKISITNPKMTRFIMGVPQSVELILSAAYYAKNSEVFIMKMPACSIQTLAEAYLSIKNLPQNHYESIGMARGDKMHEGLLSPDEKDYLLENDKFYLKVPMAIGTIGKSDSQYYKKFGFVKSKDSSFLSNAGHELPLHKVKTLLKKYIL